MTNRAIDRLVSACVSGICTDPALVCAYERRAAAVRKHIVKLVEAMRKETQ